MNVHPTAVIDNDVRLGANVTVGPFAVIGPSSEIGSGVTIGPHAVIEGFTRVADGCRIGVGTVLGSRPQDRGYDGEPTWLDIGVDTEIREYATVNRGSTASGVTRVGARCYIMSYVHVAHDCVIEDDVTIANAVQLAGHVHIGHHAWLGGSTPVHQFVRIGAHAFVGGGSRVPQDVPPFARAAGNPIRLFGINVVGLKRAGFPSETRLEIQRAFRLLFNSDLTTSEAGHMLRQRAAHVPQVMELVDFVDRSARGVMV